jgi:molecular chaperone DnaK (HSP70)
MEQLMPTHRVVAAIDFGTHGTGFAWASVDERNRDAKRRQIIFRNQWLAQPAPYPKNLTALLLDENNEVVTWGYDAKRRWSASRPSSDTGHLHYYSLFKMDLFGGDNPSASQVTDRVDIRHLIASYLKHIYKIALGDITSSGYTEDEIRWCLTVPAIWDDYQKQEMREAAVAAGLPGDDKRLFFALEPEAAAYHARVAGVRTVRTSGKRPSLMSPGSRFMVADCGGGTVDITAYRTDANNALEEIGSSYGGKYGSEYVNHEFVVQILAQRFGSFDRLQSLTDKSATALSEIIDAWENAKLHISLDQMDAIYLPLPAAIDRQLDDEGRRMLASQQEGVDDAIVVTAVEARKAFDTVVSEILGIVDAQLNEMKNQRRGAPGKELIVLVGGFGASPYLQQRLQEHVDGRADVLVPGDPRVAVLFGAVHFAYDPQTRARRTKYTYGCETRKPFRKGIDSEDRLVIDYNGESHCEGRFDVFVKAKETVAVGHEVMKTYVPISPDQRTIELRVFATHELRPRYVNDAGSQEIGSLSVDLSKVMHLALNDRAILAYMTFGDTETRVRAVLRDTGESVETTLRFDPLY